MLEALKVLIPLLEANASTLDAEYHAADHRLREAQEARTAALEKSREADTLLQLIKDYVQGASLEAPL